jgi:putative phosphoribosyl transferase
MRFADRREAGARLGEAVAALEPSRPLVAALPRGGVPVGFEVAAALGCELDVLVVRKVGVPYQPELAMGAVGEQGVVIRNIDVLEATRIDDAAFQTAARSEAEEVAARLARYRTAAPAVDRAGRTVVITDDGLATGSTALAAVDVARAQGASEVWVAVPVAPPEAIRSVERVADRVVALHRPHRFMAVGAWYRDFSQTSSEEAGELLRRSRAHH